MSMVYKGFEIRPHQQHPRSLLIAHYGKAGKIPNVLQGLFTDYNRAKEAIDNYTEDKVAA